MNDNEEMPREPGIRSISSFYRNFGGEDVIVRPASKDQTAFRIEILLTGGKAIFPPAAPVHERDVVERVDPRGGVIEYVISQYEFSKDPFGHGNDHWEATLSEKGRVNRPFAQPNIVVHGGTNQISVGNSNELHQTTNVSARQELNAALDKVLKEMPRSDIPGDQALLIEEAIADAKEKAANSSDTGIVKRSLYAIRGILSEIVSSAGGGVNEGVKAWVAAATTILIKHLAGL